MNIATENHRPNNAPKNVAEKTYSKFIEMLSKSISELENGNLRLSRSYSALEYPSTNIAITAPFGAGKSFFCHEWVKKFEEEKKSLPTFLQAKDVVYFNAYKFDYLNDPLIPLIGALKAKSYIKDTLSKLAPSLVRMAGNMILPGIGIGDTCAELLQKFSEEKDPIEEFRYQLQQELQGKELILIIDELDRCKPSYAIKLIEIVKHLFCVENIIFVFTINLDALIMTLQKEYGYDYPTANDYLNRFFIMRLTFPHKEISESIFELYMDKLRASRINLHFVKLLIKTETARNIIIFLQQAILYFSVLEKNYKSTDFILLFLRYKNPMFFNQLYHHKKISLEDFFDLLLKNIGVLPSNIDQENFIHLSREFLPLFCQLTECMEQIKINSLIDGPFKNLCNKYNFNYEPVIESMNHISNCNIKDYLQRYISRTDFELKLEEIETFISIKN